jgi:LAO/AO transport system kinase
MKVAVLAVDPSSSLTGGSILGDKTRMETLSKRPDCFIRPSPSGGSLGGVTRRTRESIRVCEAAGFDVILVETVGVGQSEIAVRSMVDCFLLLIIAGAGDELQGIKKGIVEIADLLLVNKADGENRARAELTRSSFANVIPILCPDTHGWIPPVLAISAAEHIGISNCWQQIEGYFAHLTNTDQLEPRRRRQALDWCRAHVAGELYSRFQEDPEIASETVRIEKAILEGVMEPSLAAETLLEYLRPPKQA